MSQHSFQKHRGKEGRGTGFEWKFQLSPRRLEFVSCLIPSFRSHFLILSKKILCINLTKYHRAQAFEALALGGNTKGQFQHSGWNTGWLRLNQNQERTSPTLDDDTLAVKCGMYKPKIYILIKHSYTNKYYNLKSASPSLFLFNVL